ncbi:MAG: hypothetical protein ACR2RE_27905, partial [Geminicoccaceae bacterium]
RALEELHNVKVRLTNLEENVAASNRRMDRFDERLERIERQSDIADTLIEQLRRRANDSKK